MAMSVADKTKNEKQAPDGVDFQIPTYGKITPRLYQWEAFESVRNYIRQEWSDIKSGQKKNFSAGYIEAYVAAGKTIMMAMVAEYTSSVGGKVMILARAAELVRQNSGKCRDMGAKNSVYSASLNLKSKYHNIVVGTEGTVSNEVGEGGDFYEREDVPHVLLIDECHGVDNHEVQKCLDDPNYESSNQYAKIISHFIRVRPNIAIIGFTGTPFRGEEKIDGVFWTGGRIGKAIDREWLTEQGFIHNVTFDFPESKLDLSEFMDKFKDGLVDFSKKELEKIGDATKLEDIEKIALYMRYAMKERNAALVTCASVKQCKQLARFLPDGQWAIITESTNPIERMRYLDQANEGKLKYILQIQCLSTGVDVPLWDTIFLLRPIGSLALLIQLIGRGVRLLEPQHEEAGYEKSECLVIDFTDTMEMMHDQFDDPMLDSAELQKAKKDKKANKVCPVCSFKNSDGARRCVNVIEGEKCDHFWSYNECKNRTGGRVSGFEKELTNADGKIVDHGEFKSYDNSEENRVSELKSCSGESLFYGDTKCFVSMKGFLCDEKGNNMINSMGGIGEFKFDEVCNTKNDKCARECRCCGHSFVNFNDKLNGKHYQPGDFIDVADFKFGKAKNGGIWVRIHFDDYVNNEQRVARLFYSLDKPLAKRIFYNEFLKRFVRNKKARNEMYEIIKIYKISNADKILEMRKYICAPKRATHKVNAKGKYLVSKLDFGDSK
jgi:superfamily II DNA or RNA helicase